MTDTVVGTGAAAATGTTVNVKYTGWLYKLERADFKGTQFDSSVQGSLRRSCWRDTGTLIAGFDQGVTGMKVGGKRTVLIPSSLGLRATGAASASRRIPAWCSNRTVTAVK